MPLQSVTISVYEDDLKAISEWLEGQLREIIGLAEVKDLLRQLVKTVVLDKKRQAEGLAKGNFLSPHMVFSGNPGVGKTTIARLLGNLLLKLQVLSKGHCIELQRSDLVAAYIGQTALKTKQKICDARGGVLFVDEAYRLFVPGMQRDAVRVFANSHVDSQSDFGKEAVEEIMSVLADAKDLVVIFAG